MSYPERIICMTEESVEWLYLLGAQDRIAGVSTYVLRPHGVKKEKPVISAFTHANIKKIKSLKPDLILGFSDIQKDIARDLIAEGLNVFISNQRSLDEILNYLELIAAMVGESAKGQVLLSQYREELERRRKNLSLPKVRVYLEEWDEPLITGIRWFSEIVELCGGEVLFKERSLGPLAQDRFVTHQEIIEASPEMILACWCGKKVDLQSIAKRPGYEFLPAVKQGKIYELPPEIFLQPGPALFRDGFTLLDKILAT